MSVRVSAHRSRSFPHSCQVALILLLGLWSLPLTRGKTHAQPPAPGTTPTFDQEQVTRLQQARRNARQPNGLLSLLKFWNAWDWSSPEASSVALEALSQETGLPAHRRAYVSMLKAHAALRNGQPVEANRMVEALNYVNSWRIIGPFDNEGKAGFGSAFAPEVEPLAPWDPDWSTAGAGGTVRWRTFPAAAMSLGRLDFETAVSPAVHVCGYAETFVHSEQRKRLSLWAGFGGAAKVWWNGAPVFSDDAYRAPNFDRHSIPVEAARGPNRLLVKVCTTDGPWGFYLRAAGPSGAPARGVHADASQFSTVPPAVGRRAQWRSQQTDFEALRDASERGTPASLEAFAHLLEATGGADPDLTTAADLSRRSAEREPTTARLLLASRLAKTQSERVLFAERAARQDPDDREATLNLAAIRSLGIRPANALPLLRRLTGDDTVALKAAVLQAELLSQLGLVDTATRVLEEAVPAANAPAAVLAARVRIADAAGNAAQAAGLRRALLARRFDHVSSRRMLAQRAAIEGNLDQASVHLEALSAVAHDLTTRRFLGSTYLSTGDFSAAERVVAEAIELSPENPDLHALMGRVHLAMAQPVQARQSLTTALSLRPQSVGVRSLLEQLEPARQRLDEQFASSVESILQRRSDNTAYPVTVLHNLSVHTVFESGLGSAFHQYVAQANSEEGTRRLKTFSVRFDPATQHVQILRSRVHRSDGTKVEATETFEQPLGEPWYRIYYDTRALVIVFPDLELGDTIELNYRINDIGERNLFADYFGDLQFTAGSFPVKHYEYVLITPTSRDFFFNDFADGAVQHEREIRGEIRIDRFTKQDREALRTEPRMPGMTEVAPYLHVSTYRSWEDVGRWWWGLVQDQLQIDDGLRTVIAELVEGATDTETKVARIQNWVVRNTRYVGLEFGIHGYMPYRVPLIVQRGFGDCKDKASLLYVMLKEAGVDARIVLVRTRRNGRIQDLPASLAVFDHAIAYVPELDRYIDGTAEYAGSSELPFGDQGVTVLVVGPDSAELRVTPVLAAADNLKEKQSTIELLEDGSAIVQVREEISGTEAARYREMLAAAGRQEDRLERHLRRYDPGTVLEGTPSISVSDLEAPVTLSYQARVPSFALVGGGQLQLTPTSVNNLLASFAPSNDRQHPLELGAPFRYQEVRRIQIPAGFRVSELGEGGRVESEFGLVDLETSQSEGLLEIALEFEIRRDQIASNEYPAFRRFLSTADTLLRQRISLIQESP